MIELIDGIAYLASIKSPEQSLDMFEWLKQHPEQKLYIIKGIRSYGCGEKGELVPLAQMPPEKTQGEFCLNPFYAPTKEAIIKDFIEPIENPINSETSRMPPTEAFKQREECTAKMLELESELEYCNKELDKYENTVKELETDKNVLSEKIIVLQSEIDEIRMLYDEEVEHNKIMKDKLSILHMDENRIDKTDVRKLCKALYDLGFDVELKFVDSKE